jgi:rhodanese-related sulfurtransferase
MYFSDVRFNGNKMESQLAINEYVNKPDSFEASQRTSSVNPGLLHDWLKGGDVFLVDLRSPDEFEQSRIAGSFLLPRSRLNYGVFPQVSGLKTVFVCPAGAIAHDVANDLVDAGGENVFVLEGGLSAWLSAGYNLDE